MTEKKPKKQKETPETAPVKTETSDAPEVKQPHMIPWMLIALAIAIPALIIAGLALYEQRNTAARIANLETRIAEGIENAINSGVTADRLVETENRIMDEITRIKTAMENATPVTIDTTDIETRLAVIETRLTELTTPKETPATDSVVTTADTTDESSWSWRGFFGNALKITPVGDGPVEDGPVEDTN